jgi:hypothetical protein
MPMALPPEGRYEVLVEPAWGPDRAPAGRGDGRPVRARAEVVGSVVGLTSQVDLPASSRLRVTFVRTS